MNITLKFDYYSKIIYIPDGFIKNLNEVYLHFFEWLSEQSECYIATDDGYALSYNEIDFLKYINEEILVGCNEMAYIVNSVKRGKGTIPVLKF